MIKTKTLLSGILVASLAGLVACERPPIETTQTGYRGTAMVDVSNPRATPPEMGYPASMPQASGDGPLAGEVYENVQVLGRPFGRAVHAPHDGDDGMGVARTGLQLLPQRGEPRGRQHLYQGCLASHDPDDPDH